MKHSCVRVHRGESVCAPVGRSASPGDAVPGWEYARLRFDLVRMARQIAGPALADDLVQQVFRHVAKRGPAAPRDRRGLPRPAYLTSLLFALAAAESPDAVDQATGNLGVCESALAAATGARGG